MQQSMNYPMMGQQAMPQMMPQFMGNKLSGDVTQNIKNLVGLYKTPKIV
jgi:hypothetical protein